MKTEPNSPARLRRPHFDPWIGDYAADRLDSHSSRLLETHVTGCDLCFAALVAAYVRGAPAPQSTPTA